MAAFASDRRAGWVRVLVLILCALFIFASVAAPPAYAVSETVALFTAAAVLSSAVAALGFKLSTDAQGQATLSKMVEDFAKLSWATGLVIVGTRVNGLINGLNYIKMAVHNGKTYLDERVIAWCQQWLAENGVYDSGSITLNEYSSLLGKHIGFPDKDISYYFSLFPADAVSKFNLIIANYSLDLSGRVVELIYNSSSGGAGIVVSSEKWSYYADDGASFIVSYNAGNNQYYGSFTSSSISIINAGYYTYNGHSFSGAPSGYGLNAWLSFFSENNVYRVSNVADGTIESNNTGLSGTDTLGKDVIDLTLDQILEKLKEWAQDWYDAGADSATNEASGALDLPLTVTDEAATANPALNPDVVYNPPFSLPWPNVRSGETSSSTTQAGQANADAAQTATADVAENQTIVDSLVTWALGYISPDTGLFSKFPLCIPYDAYLIVCSALGVDAVDASTVYGAEPGDLAGVVTSGISAQSDFQPIIHIQHDFELDGRTYPLDVTIDLTPWQPLVDVSREGIAILFMADLIASEYRRIKGH